MASGKPAFLLKSPSYSCVSLDVSPYLAGSAEGSDPWAHRVTSGAAILWGQPARGVELALTPFSPRQKTGYLGFRVSLRGMDKPGSAPVVDCEKATLRIWRGAGLIREVSSSSGLGCFAVTPPARPYPSTTGGVLSTAFFDANLDEPGDYSFELVEQFKGVRLISNRATVQVIADR